MPTKTKPKKEGKRAKKERKRLQLSAARDHIYKEQLLKFSNQQAFEFLNKAFVELKVPRSTKRLKTAFKPKDVKTGKGVQTVNFGLTYRFAPGPRGSQFYEASTNYKYTKLYNFCLEFVLKNLGLYWLKDYTGIGINRNWETGYHRDQNNVPHTSKIIGLGSYKGGELRHYKPDSTKHNKKRNNYTDYDIKNKWLHFNSRQFHEVTKFTGTRITLTVYLDKRYKNTDMSDYQVWEEGVGVINVPTKYETKQNRKKYMEK